MVSYKTLGREKTAYVKCTVKKDVIMKTCKETAVPNGEFGKHDNVLILIGGTDSDRDWAARIMGFQGTTLTFEQFRERVQRNRERMRDYLRTG